MTRQFELTENEKSKISELTNEITIKEESESVREILNNCISMFIAGVKAGLFGKSIKTS